MTNKPIKERSTKASRQPSDRENSAPTNTAPIVDSAISSEAETMPRAGTAEHANTALKQSVMAVPTTKSGPETTANIETKANKAQKRKRSDYRNAKRLLRQLPLLTLLRVGKWIPDRIAHLAHLTENTPNPTDGDAPMASPAAENSTDAPK